MGEMGGEMDKMLAFSKKWGEVCEGRTRNIFLVHIRGYVLSEVLEEKWGEMGENWEKWGEMGGNVGGWLHKHVVYECLCSMYVCVVQLGTV